MVFVYAAVVLVGVLWLAMAVGAGVLAWQLYKEGDRPFGLFIGLIAALMLVVPGAIYYGDTDPYASVLCLHGHQEWVTTSAPVLVGKAMVPTTSTSKVWVCDQWEAR